MADNITICNQALGWLGANLINSFTESSVEAQLCNANYAELRDAVLEEGRWTFAKSYLDLSDDGYGTPNKDQWKYPYRYVIPDNVLLVLRVYRGDSIHKDVDWERSENYIFTNERDAQAETVIRITDERRFTKTFTQALAYRIAAELAMPLTHDMQIAQYYEGKYQKRLDDALAIDGMQGRNEQFRVGRLIKVRGSQGGSSFRHG